MFSHIKGAKIRLNLRQTTSSDTTVDCQHVEMHLCVFFPSGFLFNRNQYHTSLLVKHQNDNTVPQ